MQTKADTLKRALRCAFPHTLPVLTGYTFLGLTYGILMNVSGFSFWYPMLISITVFAGSMQFVAVNLLLGAFAPLQAFVMALMINARHLFYGISMLDKYRDTGRKKPYLIFGLTDETFSVNCTAEVPPEVDKHWFLFFVTLLDQLYWVAGATLGGIFGSFLPFDPEGLDFVMTAMFVVIFLEQWRKDADHTSALAGVGLSVACLVLFGRDGFLLPAMLAILLALTALRGRLEGRAPAPEAAAETTGRPQAAPCGPTTPQGGDAP